MATAPSAVAPSPNDAIAVGPSSAGRDDADLAEVRRRVASIDGVAAVSPPQRSQDQAIGKLDVTFADDPYSEEALARVSGLRETLEGLPAGVTALVGADSAVQEDFNIAAARDNRVIVPVALLVIAIILGILLEAIVAPLVLIATVVMSFFGTLGLSIFFFIEIQGSAGVDASLPTFAFIFLVALGVDYTIFLMSRMREEARTYGTREGVLRAVGHRPRDHERRPDPRRHLLRPDEPGR